MRQAMFDAEVGDDVWGDDPTVNRLQATAAELFGKEAGLYLPSGTQSNLAALMAHCGRGDEYIVGDNAHTYKYEAGGAAVLASIQPQPVRMLDDGRLDLNHAASVIKPDDPHFARSKLLCIENTHDGKALPTSFHDEAAALAEDHGLSMHLDGARSCNAAVALGVSPAELMAPFDTVSICLSKGLGAPVGSVLVGSKDLIAAAYRCRKILGGGMRQAGGLAAAGLYALEHNIDRLADDHARATRLAEGLAELGVPVTHNTNMVFADFGPSGEAVAKAANDANILLAVNDGSCRLVTHLDVDDDGVESVIATVGRALGR